MPNWQVVQVALIWCISHFIPCLATRFEEAKMPQQKRAVDINASKHGCMAAWEGRRCGDRHLRLATLYLGLPRADMARADFEDRVLLILY